MLLSIQNLKDPTGKNTQKVEKTKEKRRISKNEVRRRIKDVIAERNGLIQKQAKAEQLIDEVIK